MKIIENIIAYHAFRVETDGDEVVLKEWAIACIKEYAREAIDEIVGNLERYATIDVNSQGEVTQVNLNRKAVNKLLDKL